MDLHDAYEAVAREIEETAAKYVAGRVSVDGLPHQGRNLCLAFAAKRAEIARAVEEASKQ